MAIVGATARTNRVVPATPSGPRRAYDGCEGRPAANAIGELLVKPPRRSSVALLSATRTLRALASSVAPDGVAPFWWSVSCEAQLAQLFLSRKTSVVLLGSLSCIVFLSAAVPADPTAMFTAFVSAASAPAFTQIAPNAPAAAVPGSRMMFPTTVASMVEFPCRALIWIPTSPYRWIVLPLTKYRVWVDPLIRVVAVLLPLAKRRRTSAAFPAPEKGTPLTPNV